MLCEKTLYICEVMNKEEFVPKMPNQSDLDLVFDTNFHDIQPHLFKVQCLILENLFISYLHPCCRCVTARPALTARRSPGSTRSEDS